MTTTTKPSEVRPPVSNPRPNYDTSAQIESGTRALKTVTPDGLLAAPAREPKSSGGALLPLAIFLLVDKTQRVWFSTATQERRTPQCSTHFPLLWVQYVQPGYGANLSSLQQQQYNSRVYRVTNRVHARKRCMLFVQHLQNTRLCTNFSTYSSTIFFQYNSSTVKVQSVLLYY